MPTYTEYVAAGGTMTEAEYNASAPLAWAYLNSMTLGKAGVATGTLASTVSACFYRLADTIYQESQGGEVASASNDGYSESYVTSGKTAEQKRYSIVVAYLAATGLLDRRMGRVCCWG